MNRVFIYCYCSLLLLHLIAGSLDFDLVVLVTKPLLLTSLLIYFIFKTRRLHYGLFRNLMVWGFFFSLMGDSLLMFQSGSKEFFMGGLGAFFIAHICYLWAFTKVYRDQEIEIIKKQGWTMVLILGYGFFFFRLLQDNLGAMMGPVIAYIAVITLMLLMAINRYGRVGNRSFWLIAVGAVLFVISDSVLAWAKFMHPVNAAHLLIMGTYGTAQLCIMFGALSQVEEVAGVVTE